MSVHGWSGSHTDSLGYLSPRSIAIVTEMLVAFQQQIVDRREGDVGRPSVSRHLGRVIEDGRVVREATTDALVQRGGPGSPICERSGGSGEVHAPA